MKITSNTHIPTMTLFVILISTSSFNAYKLICNKDSQRDHKVEVELRVSFFTVFFIKYVFFTKTAVFLVCGCKVMKNQGVNQIFLAFL